MFDYAVNAKVSLEDFQSVLERSSLAARRPMDDPKCLQAMLDHSNLIVTCRNGPLLIGIARSVTDFHYCCYLSDLAVDAHYQRQGIGRQLIYLTREALGDRCQLTLLSAPAAIGYYPHLGFTHHPQCWILPPRHLQPTTPLDTPIHE